MKRLGSIPPLTSSDPKPTAAAAYTKALEALDLLQVARRSLDAQEVGPEQAAIRCAERALWSIHDFLFPLGNRPDRGDGENDT
jgi:hypothetical protein